MKTLSLTHDDIHRGDLILVNQSHALHESAAADLALHTASGKRTSAGRAMQTVTDAVDSAAASVKHTMGR